MSQSKRPTYYEIEVFRRAQSRKFWWVLGVMGATNLAAMALAALVTLRPVPVVAFDKTGRALVFRNTARPGLETDEVRIRQFTRAFLNRFIGIDGTRVQADFREALNMMSPLTRELIVKEGKQVERRKQYEGTDIRSRFTELEIRVGEFDPKAPDEDIHLFVWGRQEFAQIFGRAEPVSQYIFVKLILERQVVREVTPYGLWVRFVEYDSFADRRQMEAELLKVAQEE